MQDDIRSRKLDSTTAALVVTVMGEPIRASTLRVWEMRKRLKSCGTDEQGRKAYLLGEVYDLAVARHAKKRAPRT